MPVFEYHTLLYSLVDLFQFFNMRLVSVNSLFVFLQPVQLVFQSTVQSHSNGGDGVQLTFDPWSNSVGFFAKLPPKRFVV